MTPLPHHTTRGAALLPYLRTGSCNHLVFQAIQHLPHTGHGSCKAAGLHRSTARRRTSFCTWTTGSTTGAADPPLLPVLPELAGPLAAAALAAGHVRRWYESDAVRRWQWGHTDSPPPRDEPLDGPPLPVPVLPRTTAWASSTSALAASAIPPSARHMCTRTTPSLNESAGRDMAACQAWYSLKVRPRVQWTRSVP